MSGMIKKEFRLLTFLNFRMHELTTMKQNDRQMLNSLEQRLGYEQRQRKQIETLLVNERKMRGKAEEKTAKW